MTTSAEIESQFREYLETAEITTPEETIPGLVEAIHAMVRMGITQEDAISRAVSEIAKKTLGY